MTKLKTRPVMVATGALSVLATALIIWQVAKSPTTSPGNATTTTQTSTATSATSASSTTTRSGSGIASGLVTPAPAPSQASMQIGEVDSKVAALPEPSTADPSATVTVTPSASPSATAATSSPGARPGNTESNSGSNTRSNIRPNTTPTIKHIVVPRAAAGPPILPNEVNTVVAQAIGGQRSWLRLIYPEPLARRFVATVDGLGNKVAPNDLWLFKPVPGEIKLVPSSKQPGTQLIRRANSQRYANFVQWLLRTDNAKLLALYERMYPLLQQTYVDLGHPDGYFNDRVIEVIDLMLATPVAKPPLRVQPASLDKVPAKALSVITGTSATVPQRPRYEFSDPQLESLATGQKLLLRIGTQNAALLKPKLKALRSGLIMLGQQRPVKG